MLVERGVGFAYGCGACSEERFFFFVEVEFNNLLDTVASEDTGNTDADVFFAVFAVEEGRAGDELLLAPGM